MYTDKSEFAGHVSFDAFQHAIRIQHLDACPDSLVFAGNYMYMGCWIPVGFSVPQLAFKNIITRAYSFCPAPAEIKQDVPMDFQAA